MYLFPVPPTPCYIIGFMVNHIFVFFSIFSECADLNDKAAKIK